MHLWVQEDQPQAAVARAIANTVTTKNRLEKDLQGKLNLCTILLFSSKSQINQESKSDDQFFCARTLRTAFVKLLFVYSKVNLGAIQNMLVIKIRQTCSRAED